MCIRLVFFVGIGEDEEILYCYFFCGLFSVLFLRNVKVAVINKVKVKFKFLGKFMVKVLMDFRMVSIYIIFYFIIVVWDYWNVKLIVLLYYL